MIQGSSHMKPATEAALTLRVPVDTLNRIDVLVGSRPSKIPRHSWLLEAIYEKLQKEERVCGSLEIRRWKDGNSPALLYRLRFLRDDLPKRRPVVPRFVVGLDWVKQHLVEWGLPPDIAELWLSRLESDRSVAIPGVMMPATE